MPPGLESSFRTSAGWVRPKEAWAAAAARLEDDRVRWSTRVVHGMQYAE